ncbi:pilus assembly protein TadB [Blastococcus sp. CT_GayMR16]|uniref:type II secretion system F family protein n=1 Tax=Blastococcus sp. CT_GayMR16 TaxID=2559607 RepID=UPI0010740590|nr:pilus assembly protein TadB [Blastococcus sp. CT_GayMR16]TFV90551.1 pilus assembly protein TadB [Blastococcus sp. CT_GayMR16]
MTAALVSAIALLAWPDDGLLRRARVAAVLGSGIARPRGPTGLRDLPIPPSAGAVGSLAGALLSTPLVAVLAGTGAFLAARAWGASRKSRESDARLRSLADGLAALAADLRSGRSLETATGAAVSACADSGCGGELARALRAPEAPPSGTADPALAEAMVRIAAAVRLSTRTGCSLASVAGAVEDDLRARSRHRLELRGATAAPRASASLLAGLPLLGLAMGSGVGADPWAVLTGTGVGQVLLVAGVALEAAGLAWTRRLVARAVR